MSWLEVIAERRILDALEQGLFEDLPGRGRPLPPDPAEKVAPEHRTAYRLMREAGIAPDWIELDRAIRTREQGLAKQARTLLARPGAGHHANYRRGRLLREIETELHALNRQIDTLNLIAPSMRLHRRRIDFQRWLEGIALEDEAECAGDA